MRGKSWLQIGSICMGIGGSIIDSDFIESYLGMRVESVDEVEIIRRMTEGIYDHDEFERALKWAKETCTIGWDKNPEELQISEEKKEEQFEFVVKMAVIIKELMNGCDNLDPEFSEEAIGHNALAAGFQGQRQWTDFYPNGDFAEAMLNTSLTGTEHVSRTSCYRERCSQRTWNAVHETSYNVLRSSLMFVHTGARRQLRKLQDMTLRVLPKKNGGFLHLINSGAACLDANGGAKEADGNAVMKQWWDVTEEDQKAIMDPLHRMVYGRQRILPWRRILQPF